MKKCIAILSLSILIAFSTFFSSCEKESYENEISKQAKVSSEEISLNQVLAEIDNPIIKKHIKDKLKPSIGLYENRTLDNYLNFIKIIKENEYTTYSLLINSYNSEKPYFEYFIITKDANTEKAGYAKFIPNYPITVLDEKHFDGKLQISDLQGEIKGETQFINSQAQPVYETQSGCFNAYYIVVHYCTNGDHHAPGESCEGGLVNDAYYQIVSTVICIDPSINYLAPPTEFMGLSGGGGSGAMSTNLDVMLFLTDLSDEQLSIVQQFPELITYLENNNATAESKEFTIELINLAIEEPNQDDLFNIINFILTAKTQDKIVNEFDETFLLSVDPFLDMDANAVASMIGYDQLAMHFSIQCAVLRANHPDWSSARVYWEASKEFIHFVLDAFGLFPVFGEVADLTNGVLYLVEGDGANATLSFASAVPVAGWASTGVKYAFKIKEVASISSKVKLTWKVVGNTIDFGTSSQLRKVLGLLPGNPLQAHHLIPWATRNNTVIQRAAKSGSAFHMNEALNGIAVAAWRNQPNHTAYNNLINTKLNNFINLNPNATPQECYEFLTDLIDNIRTWVVNNPNSHLNDLVLP